MSLNGMRELKNSIRLGIVGQPIKKESNRSPIGVQSESTQWSANPILYWKSLENGESNGVQSESNRSPIGVQSAGKRELKHSIRLGIVGQPIKRESNRSPIGVQSESTNYVRELSRNFLSPDGPVYVFLHVPWHKLCA